MLSIGMAHLVRVVLSCEMVRSTYLVLSIVTARSLGLVPLGYLARSVNSVLSTVKAHSSVLVLSKRLVRSYAMVPSTVMARSPH